MDRRNKALAGLQATARSRGKTLQVSYTLQVMPSGLTDDGVTLLQNAVANGIEVAVVNIMAMDYGNSVDPNQMGSNATQAATSTFNQLKPLYPSKTDSQVWAIIGITPMLGRNDVSPEVFTVSDAQQVLTFAQQKGIARLAMWSAGRDQACPNSGMYVSPTCSGISQSPWAFSQTFLPFTRP